jgi:hypothetical protein
VNDAIEQRSHRNILAASEEDLLRKRERERRPLPPVPWRFHAGTWQRWSELDREFAPHQPPSSLVEHAQATGGPVEDQVLELVAGAWAPAGEHPTAGVEARIAPEAPVAPEPVPPPTGESDAAAFEAQIEAWRRRR